MGLIGKVQIFQEILYSFFSNVRDRKPAWLVLNLSIFKFFIFIKNTKSSLRDYYEGLFFKLISKSHFKG